MPSFAAVDGTELAYRVAGEGEPLICIPGGPMRASSYLGDLGGLSETRRLVLLDLRGTGRSAVSDDPATYRCDRQVADIEALREHLGLERVDVLAHSAGGDIAPIYAARFPQRVRSLVLVTARARALGIDFTVEQRLEAAELRRGEPWFKAGWDAYKAIWAGTATDADWDAAAPFFYGRWDDAAREHAGAEVEQTNEEAADLYASSGAFEPVSAADTPALILAGELDGGPLPRVAADIAGHFANAELVVQPGAGHYPWLDDPARFVRTVAGFLRSR